MEQKHDPGKWPGVFFSGKGFYIVLLLCGAIIAMTAMMLRLREEGTMEADLTGETEMTMATLPTPTPLPKIPAGSKKPVSEAPAVQQETLGEQPEEPRGATVWTEEEEKTAETVEPLPLYFIWPVSGALDRDYSRDELSYDRTMGDWRTHEGWDIAAAMGGSVLSAADGTVSRVYTDELYGTTVEINHGCGVVSCYANLSDSPAVSVGERVRVGDVIGQVGDTALCEVGEECHLHFAMKLNGALEDPARWLPER